jgi:hypothetical protein
MSLFDTRPKCCPTSFLSKSMHNLNCEKVAQNVGLGYICNFQKAVRSKQSPFGQTFAQSGVDVMLAIFCDYRHFSAKKLAFFSKTNVMIIFFLNLALFRVKNANFSPFFGENILKIITSVPGHPAATYLCTYI